MGRPRAGGGGREGRPGLSWGGGQHPGDLGEGRGGRGGTGSLPGPGAELGGLRGEEVLVEGVPGVRGGGQLGGQGGPAMGEAEGAQSGEKGRELVYVRRPGVAEALLHQY